MENWIDNIEELLIKELSPSKLIIEDKSHLHKDHPTGGASKNHVKIQIDSSLFKEKSKVEQHKMVLDLLKPHLNNDLHSVSIKTNPCDE